MAEIEVQSNEGFPRRVLLNRPRLVIGRSEESDVFLPDTLLSRRHAEIEQRSDGFYLIDLGSTNGTFLNGARVTGEQRLRHGDLIAVGDSKLVFSENDREDAGDNTALLGAQSYAIRDLHKRTTNPAVEVVDLTNQGRLFHLLSRATSSLLGNRPLPELFERVLDVIFQAINAERAAVVLLDQHTGAPQIRAARSRVGEPITKISRGISRRVVEQRVGLLIANIFEDAALRGRESVLVTGVRSAICAPLWLAPRFGAAEEVIGLIYADTTESARAFSEGDLEILTAFANVAASKIESTRLLEQNKDVERLESEMEAAAEIQRSILPREAPFVPGCQLAGDSRSCEAVGGDYHDYQWDGQQLSLALADVSGKGLGAAMLMTALRSAVHAHWRDDSLASATARINRTFFENVPVDRYATCFLARFDPHAGKMTYVNAGHPPALLIRAGGTADRLGVGGPGVGLFEAGDFETGTATFGAGDTLLIYSDGVSESWPTHEAAEEALVDMARSYSAIPVAPLCEEILATVDRRRGTLRSDDCTLIVLRWSPARR